MHSPPPWTAAIQAHHEVLAFLHGPHGHEYVETWEMERFQAYGFEHGQPSVVAGRFLTQDTYRADPIYISPDMLKIVFAAMEGFDSTESMGEDDFFIHNGFAYLPEPFYSITRDSKRVCWRAISWNLTTMWTIDMGQEQLADKLHKTGRADFSEEELQEAGITPDSELVARIAMWSHLDDEDDFPMPPDVRPMIERMNTRWLISHMTALPVSVMPDIREVRGEGDEKAAWLIFLRVLNRVMAEKVISKERQRPPRPMRRYAEKKNWPVKDVVVVELRRKTHASPKSENGGREYSHQWIVEGHWRNQWYPKLKRHRQRYIASYVKGPEDKPLVTKGRVWNLDR